MKNHNNIWTIVGKEFARFFGDRTLLFTAVIMPGLLIYIIYSLIGSNLSDMHKADTDLPPTVFVDYLPASFSADFDSMPFRVATEGFNAIALVGDSLHEKKCNLIYVAFPPDFDSLVNARLEGNDATVPNVRIYHNSTSANSEMAYNYVRNVLENWEHQRINLFDINEMDPETSESFDMATPEDTLGDILGQMIPMLLLMLLFSGCMAVAPSAIAGEKERGTIATLLVTPMRRSELATGKILSLAVFALLSGLSSFLGIILALPKMLQGDDIDFAIPYGTTDYLMILCVLLTTVLVMISCISILSALAKDVKSAGTLVLPLMLLILFAGFMPMLSDTAPQSLVNYLIPFYNSVESMASVFKFEMNAAALTVTILSNLTYTVIAIVVLTKMFNSEKVMFGK